MLYIIILFAVALIATSALLLHTKKQYKNLKDDFATLDSKRIATENALSGANASLERVKAEYAREQEVKGEWVEKIHTLEVAKKSLETEVKNLRDRIRTDSETAEAAIQSLKAKLNAAVTAKHVDLETASKDAETAQRELDKTDAAIVYLDKESTCIGRILSPPEVPGIVGGTIAVVGLDEDGHALGAGWIKSLKQSWDQAFEELGRLINSYNYGNNVARFLVLTDRRIGNLISENPNWREKFTETIRKSKVGECPIIEAWKVEEAFKKRREDIAAEIEALYKARRALEEKYTGHVTSMIA